MVFTCSCDVIVAFSNLFKTVSSLSFCFSDRRHCYLCHQLVSVSGKKRRQVQFEAVSLF